MLVSAKPRLAFISPIFLFPNDAGGKIRTTNILRGLKGGAFDITLASAATETQARDWEPELKSICDEFLPWQAAQPKPRWMRAMNILDPLPVNITSDRTTAGLDAVARLAQRQDIDLIVFDFVHSAVLQPRTMHCASVCFTHNVEAEIFARHTKQASNFLWRMLWKSQHGKMLRFERDALRRFNGVIAVSDRDAKAFGEEYGIEKARAIPTGVDLDFFSFQPPPPVAASSPPTVVFTGSMDWVANVDGVQFFIDQVWPKVLAAEPNARFVVVGRNPPPGLLASARRMRNVEFTGFVDDVRPYVHAAHAFVIPLLVGGGTRIKAFEAMAMGCPIVSTSIGMEGLSAREDAEYLRRDDADSMAAALLELLRNPGMRDDMARRARKLVEDKFGHRVAAEVFESICLDVLEAHRKASGVRKSSASQEVTPAPEESVR
jgi:glycosyltransferase involved in cell wall biosynthesis